MIENLKEREKKLEDDKADKPPKEVMEKKKDQVELDIAAAENEAKAQIDMELMRKKKWLTWKFVSFEKQKVFY